MALKAGVTFAQFVMMTPFPGTVDFGRWEKEQSTHPTMVGDVPITRYWLIPTEVRPKMFTPHPTMSSDEIRERTQKVWDSFYNWSSIWERSACTPTLKARIAFMFLSKLSGRCMRAPAFRPTVHGARSPSAGRGGQRTSAKSCSGPSRCRSSKGPSGRLEFLPWARRPLRAATAEKCAGRLLRFQKNS